ncbi:uncharacterized protein N0V89_003905 [Didymosphaeria variabile]|uniref:J domain-containing protein n=1 Tax=Didymosphaeria variabile TaxID=1932322 RepID=A0A9W8XPE3_9PLEO|nr:uncharacterized protein N0V89_003905 [Didymosphaeria variabile]KAJ4355882.1 hypothetical protein N0V89_003905 [Didymosphaeria variabile]
MCKIRIEPLHRNSTPKPINSRTPPASASKLPKQHSKPSKMALPRTFCLSSASASLTPSTCLTTFTNHYEVLGLDHWATDEEVKAQFRTLRAKYFSTDVGKYRQLQTAYAVLVDWEARREYDAVYRVSMGLSPPASERASASESNSEKATDETVLASSGSASSTASPPKSTIVRVAVSRIDAHARADTDSMQMAKLEEELRRVEEEQRQGEEEERLADPNWGLKHFSPQYKSLIGTRRYSSYVPIAEKYEHGDIKPRSRRPTYVGGIATNAVP